MAPVEAACVGRAMRGASILFSAALLAGCGSGDSFAENAVPPTINELAETPGDWSRLSGAIGRTPGESALFISSPITVDLNALLGPDSEAFRSAMADAGPLVWEEGVLVTRSRKGDAYLLIAPGDRALEAGLRGRQGWRSSRTAGADITRPATVRSLLSG